MNHQQSLRAMACLGLVALLLVGCSGGQVQPTATSTTAPQTPMERLDGQRALFVLPDRFSDSEYSIPRDILEGLGVVVTVASWSSNPVMGSGGNEVRPEVLLGDVHAGDYDAIVFVGGQGVRSGDPEAQRIAQEAAAKGRVVAAICAAQAILTRAGVVEGNRVNPVSVERDGLIIRARGPLQSREFGETIAAALGK
jgi:hypothetical protein